MATYLGAAAPPNAFDSLRTIVDTYLAELPESSVRLPSELIRAGATLSVDELLLAISSHAQHVYFRDNDSEYEDDGEAHFVSVMATRREYALKPERGERQSNLDDLLRCCERAGRCLSLKHWSDFSGASEHESLASFNDRDFDRYDVVFVAQISSVLGLVIIIRKEDEDGATDYALGLQQDFQIDEL